MSWEKSLVRLADFEVEGLRKRLAVVIARRADLETRLAVLHAQAEAENSAQDVDAQAGWYRIGFLQGWRLRRDALLADIQAVSLEEEGARDALNLAYAELKKYEQVAETSRLTGVALTARRERAELDEMGQRRAAGR